MYPFVFNGFQRRSSDLAGTSFGRRARSGSCAALLALLAGCSAYAPDGAAGEAAQVGSERQISSLGSVKQALVDNEPPADIELRTLKLGDIALRVLSQQTGEDETSISVGGRVWIDTPAGSLPLDVIPGAALTFTKEPSGLLRT